MKKRTRARELALQFLYQIDLLGPGALRGLEDFLNSEEADRETTKYARGLIEGTLEAKEQIDATIQEVAQNWEIPRMAVIDRNVLRLATYEILLCPDIPPKVAINEAIELGKRYSTQNSGGFINGILDKVKDRAGKGTPAPVKAPKPAKASEQPESESADQPASLPGNAAEIRKAAETRKSDAPASAERRNRPRLPVTGEAGPDQDES